MYNTCTFSDPCIFTHTKAKAGTKILIKTTTKMMPRPVLWTYCDQTNGRQGVNDSTSPKTFMWHTFVVSTVIQMFTNVIFVTLPSLRRILTCFSPQEFCYSCRGPWVLLVLWFALYTLSTYMHFDWNWDTALCVYDINVCALNITKDCGADQLDHEEDPVVGAVVLNQHQQYIDIEY